MTTLGEVAAAAGVSTATASLVLSGKDKGRVSRKTAERVRLTADSMSYVRDALAGGMRNRRTRTVGVLGEQVLSTPYAVAMIDAILTASRELGWSVLLTDSGGQEEQTRRAVRELRSRRVDAIIHAAMYHQEVRVPPEAANVAVLNGFTDRDDVVAVGEAVEDGHIGGLRRDAHLLVVHRGVDDGIDPAGPQLAHGSAGLLLLTSGVGEQDGPAELAAGGQDGVDHGDRVGGGQDLLPQDADGAGPAVAHAPREGVAHVGHGVRGEADALGGLAGDPSLVLSGQDERGGGGGHARRGGHLAEGRHRPPSRVGSAPGPRPGWNNHAS